MLTEPWNELLQAIPLPERNRILQLMSRVQTPRGEVLVRSGQRLRYALFPVSGVISSIVQMMDGHTVEGALIGREGMAGLGLLAGEMTSPYRLTQQVSGESLRIEARKLGALLEDSRLLRQLMQRYAVAQVWSAEQNAACHRHHSLEQRMCRWLLEMADRSLSDRLEVTQELMSQMLGIRRQSVNLTIRALQQAGAITYRRGKLSIVNRPALELEACECYRLIRQVHDWVIQLHNQN